MRGRARLNPATGAERRGRWHEAERIFRWLEPNPGDAAPASFGALRLTLGRHARGEPIFGVRAEIPGIGVASAVCVRSPAGSRES